MPYGNRYNRSGRRSFRRRRSRRFTKRNTKWLKYTMDGTIDQLWRNTDNTNFVVDLIQLLSDGEDENVKIAMVLGLNISFLKISVSLTSNQGTTRIKGGAYVLDRKRRTDQLEGVKPKLAISLTDSGFSKDRTFITRKQIGIGGEKSLHLHLKRISPNTCTIGIDVSANVQILSQALSTARLYLNQSVINTITGQSLGLTAEAFKQGGGDPKATFNVLSQMATQSQQRSQTSNRIVPSFEPIIPGVPATSQNWEDSTLSQSFSQPEFEEDVPFEG